MRPVGEQVGVAVMLARTCTGSAAGAFAAFATLVEWGVGAFSRPRIALPDAVKLALFPLAPVASTLRPDVLTKAALDVAPLLVAILFIIFDLEVAFLFPWAVSLGGIGMFGFWSMMVFLGVLTIGFIYEWKKGALEWE